jgi:2'-hydroxyisoflavone reductase
VVVGPDDPTDRFTYWPARVKRGGEVLAPGGPEVPTQWVDARDLASFLVTLLEQEAEGTYNAVSQADRFTLGALLDACRQESDSARVTWVAEEFLLEHGVAPFRDLPLWLAGDSANFARVDGSKATAAGLRIRLIDDTVRDTLRWFLGSGDRALSAGLDPARERELLSEWHRLQGA